MKGLQFLHTPRGRLILALAICSLISVSAVAVYAYRSAWEANTTLRQAILQAVIGEQLAYAEKGFSSPEHSILVEISNQDAELLPIAWNDRPHQELWMYEGGKIRIATETELDTYNQELQAFEYIFVVRRIQYGRAWVDVATHYPKGKNPGFGQFGGYGAHWVFKRTGAGWVVENETPFTFWD